MNIEKDNPALIFIWMIVFVFFASKIVDLEKFILFKNSYFEFYQLLTSSFLHLNFQHLLSNSFWLLIISKFLNRNYFLKFSIMWFIFAIWASIFSFIFENNPVLWASWVVMGFLSYFYLLNKDTEDMWWLFIVLIINIFAGFLPWISFWGHIWWAIFWALFYFLEDFFDKK